jgi:hypothetical protein
MLFRHCLLLVIVTLVITGMVPAAEADRNAGIFYSTLYAKTMEPELLSDFGGDATHWFLSDVNGDSQADAVAYYASGGSLGQWHVALSDGETFGAGALWLDDASATSDMKPLMGDVDGDGFQDAVLFNPSNGSWFVSFSNGLGFDAPIQFTTGNGVGSTNQYLADMDGDGADDAVLAWEVWLGGRWYVGKSNGVDAFGGFSSWITNFGSGSDQRFVGDADGDGKADAILYFKNTGNWEVALSDGNSLTDDGVWRADFGTGEEFGFADDIDGDDIVDIGYHNITSPYLGDWWVAYSDTTVFTGQHRWVADLGQRTGGKSNPPPVVTHLTGHISANTGWACIVDEWGRWFAVNNPIKNKTLVLKEQNTYVAWRNAYDPKLPGFEGTYDSGDPNVNDLQIQMMHDAGFNYVMLDITNGYNAWVDDRAQSLINRIRHWNQNLQPGQHRMYATMALGRTRQIKDYDAFFAKLEAEAKRCWDDWYGPHQDVWYYLDGKPLLIHMVGGSNNLHLQLDDFTGDRWHIDQFSNRWMQGSGANSYGWIIPDDNPYHPEMMAVKPGFWNGSYFRDRDDGEFYRNHWRRVMEYQPDSVWVNSMNETWEHTSIEPAYMFNDREPHPGITHWTDLYGDRMDDFYWVMTQQYMKLYMENVLYEDTYLQDYISPGNFGPIYKATSGGLVQQSQPPHFAPVLLLPSGFTSSFTGQIVATDAPYTPTGLVASATDTSVNLDWDDHVDPNLDHYAIYRTTTSGGSYTAIDTTTVSQYTDTNVTYGVTYYYVVTAVKDVSNGSVYSNEVSATPKNPGIEITLQAEDALLDRSSVSSSGTGWNGTGYVQIGSFGYAEFTFSVPHAGSYDLQLNCAGDIASMAAEIRLNGNLLVSSLSIPNTGSWDSIWQEVAIVDVSLPAGVNTIRIADNGSERPNIDQLRVLDLSPPAAPTCLTATNSGSVITLNWDDNSESDLASYNVYRSESLGGVKTAIATELTNSQYSDPNITVDTPYYYTVTATDLGELESAHSHQAGLMSPSGVTYQAEDGFIFKGTTSSSGSGWNGSGFVDLGEIGLVQWTINLASAGLYDLKFTVTGDAGGMAAEIRVNDAVINSSLPCPDTNSWDSNWQSVTELGVALNAGSNTIRFTDSGDSAPSIDQLAVIEPTNSVVPGDCDGDGHVSSIVDALHALDCLSGTGNTTSAGCECDDIDADGDSDLQDFADIQQAVVGSPC